MTGTIEDHQTTQRIGSELGFAGQPAGLSALFFTELWERFSYYGMRALLVLFMVAAPENGGLGFSTVDAAVIYGNYTMAVYMLSIPGGIIADRRLGANRAVLLGGMIIALGHFTLAIPAVWSFYVGLLLVAVGTGLFKPSISTLVGGLYARDDERRDAGFSLFYMGINIGAFFAPLVTGFLAQSDPFKSWLASMGLNPAISWHFGFAAAGVGMAIAMIIYAARRGRFAEIAGPRPEPQQNDWRVIALAIAGTAVLMALLTASDWEGWTWLRPLVLAVPLAAIIVFAFQDGVDAQRLAAIFVFFIAAMMFWAIFEQAGLTIALFADQLTQNEIAGVNFPSAWFQSLNPLFVILLAPLFAALWLRMGASQPSSPVKFALGLGFLALSFALMVPAATLTAAGKVSPLWLVGLFFLQTVGEMLLSPVGLSTMTKLAPVRAVGLVLGIWFLGAAFGNKLASVLGSGFNATDPAGLAQFFTQQAVLVAVCAALMLLATPWLKRLMGGVR